MQLVMTRSMELNKIHPSIITYYSLVFTKRKHKHKIKLQDKSQAKDVAKCAT